MTDPAKEQAAINKLKAIQVEYDWDQEVAHILADELLCDLLTQLGYSKVVEEFEKMDKWYA